ncbi:two-component system regulatory protein YycI [Gracilibacillus massiliensis]|uniref:two-component system regulatory protein YycI n=1 Tax=Gracilibacillus massiliensis TaxID=1564956 RepID=UPI00071E4925|nr:two-component system regulatory protein YycI [Gracilibacillus massiliensis]
MQWGQIKTLFILCFLILNIFLLNHFLENLTGDLPLIEDMSREENVRNNVNGLDHIPEEPPAEEAMLYAQRKEFTEEETKEIMELPDQNNIVIDNHLIISQMESPLAISVEENTEALSEHIWNFDSYQYFGKDEKTNTHIFFQTIDRPIYFNLSGVLLIQENEQNEVVHYVQTMLEKADEETEQEEINKPFDALTGLYFSEGNIVSGDEITKEVRLGYHNLLPLPNGVQMLAPTWEFEVNNDEHFYVNAVESHYTIREKNEFIIEMKDQIAEYFVEGSSAVIEASNEDWEEEDLEQLLERLLDNIELTNGVE